MPELPRKVYMNADEPKEYVVPTYRAAEDEPWFHFLHGNVPGHEIDFMYRPEVPQGLLTPQHHSHLARLMRYIEPAQGAEHAFSIGNLSRDDTQHEPGHGGVALLFGLRIRGASDHAGRPDPPFAHGIAAIDRALDAPALLEAATAFHRRVLDEAGSAAWYRAYVAAAGEPRESLARVLAGYVASFGDLPRPAPSALGLAWTLGGETPPGRVLLVYPDDAPFELLARAATRLAAVLYRSDVRWTAISSGREADVPGGLSVRLVAESAAASGDPDAARRRIEEIPADDEALARELFGARPVEQAKPTAPGWRERRVSESGGEECGGSLAPFEPEIPGTLLALARVLSSSARPRSLVVDDAEDDAGMDLAGFPGDDAREPAAVAAPREAREEASSDAEPGTSEPASDLVLTGEAPAAPAAPMTPIAVPLPLVSPPPLSGPSTAPAPPVAPRWRKAAVFAACCLAGLVAARYGRFQTRIDAPVAAPTTLPQVERPAASSSAPVGVSEPATPAPSTEPTSPEPPRTEKTLTSGTPGRSKTGAAGGANPCRVVGGKPCF